MSRTSRLVAAVVIGALFLALTGYFFGTEVDDGRIVARYAVNLISRGELVNNPGDRILELTSPLHGLVEGLLYAMTRATLPANDVGSALAVVAAAVLVGRELRATPRLAFVVAATIVLSPFVGMWVAGGLETPYLLLLVTLMAISVRRAEAE